MPTSSFRTHNLATLTDDPVRQEWCNLKKVEQVQETIARVMPVTAVLCAGSAYRELGVWFQEQLVGWCAQRCAEVRLTV